MKDKKILIISIITIILFIAIVGSILYLKTDLFKSDKELFLSSLTGIKTIEPQYITKYNEAIKKIDANSRVTSSNTSITINDGSAQISDPKEVASFKTNAIYNKNTNQTYKDFSLSMQNQEFANIKYIQDNDIYGIKIENVLSKYMAIQNTNLKSLASKLGVSDVSNIPNSLDLNKKSVLDIDNNTKTKIIETYKTVLLNHLNEDNFSKTKLENGEKELILSFSEVDMANILIDILETAKNDTTLQNLIIEKSKEIGNTEIDIQKFQTGINEAIADIDIESLNKTRDFLVISLIKNKKNVDKIKISINVDSTSRSIDSEEYWDEPDTEKMNILLEFDISEANKVIVTVYKDNTELNKINIEYEMDNTNISVNVNSDTKSNNFPIQTENIQYVINNYNSDNIKQYINATVVTSDNTSIKANMEINTSLKQDVQIEKLTTENAVILNNQTKEDLEKIKQAIINRINQVYGSQISQVESMF